MFDKLQNNVFFVAVTQCAVAVNNRAIQLQTASYRNWYRHDTWRYRGTAIYRDLFDSDIETLVLTILTNIEYRVFLSVKCALNN